MGRGLPRTGRRIRKGLEALALPLDLKLRCWVSSSLIQQRDLSSKSLSVSLTDEGHLINLDSRWAKSRRG
jgi:hypothetical protein